MKTAPLLSAVIDSPIGKLGITVIEEALHEIHFLSPTTPLKQNSDLSVVKVITALNHYFDNPKYQFTLQLSIKGSLFQKNVWRELQAIPPGITLTYGDIAKKLKSHPRAIGQACRRNLIPIVIPCHRIISKENIGGFAGFKEGRLTDIKRWLLNHEQ